MIAMNGNAESMDTRAIEDFATECGVAIALVDSTSSEVSVFNNNSICDSLNPTGKFSPDCARFCGAAFEEANRASEPVAFECHAGLECRAVPIGKRLVAITGRTFIKAENYRRATERAITGDWTGYQPSALFENVLLTASPDVLDNAARRLSTGSAKAEGRDGSKAELTRPVSPARSTEALPTANARAWRSFFGSMLGKDYQTATASILEFLARQYGFSSVIWLERREDTFENTLNFGELKDRRIRLGIAANDERLVAAGKRELPLEVSERYGPDGQRTRTLSLFPIVVGDVVTASIAVLDPIEEETRKRQIARICLSLAPQIEILRLRNDIEQRESLSRAVRRFGESLRRIDSDDFWLAVTQSAAEMLGAERASLMTFDDRSNELEIRASVGSVTELKDVEPVGRVAQVVFEKGEPVIIANVSRAGLQPAPERRYKTQSFMSSPVSLAGRTIGVMNFTDRVSGMNFDRQALELFQAVAPQLAVAIDRVTLKDRAGEFEQLSVTDALTGLLNRRYIEARLAEEIKRSNRHGFPMSLMLLDVDYFKSYNDQFGHPAGDEALRLVAGVIRDTLRGADVAARFGGEEFSILLPQTTAEEAAAIAERLRQNMENAEFPHRSVTSSIGVVSCSAELCASADLISAADKALYEAKRLGRNRVTVFEEIGATGAK